MVTGFHVGTELDEYLGLETNKDPGAAPGCFCAVACKRRFGPSAYLLPGVPSFFTNFDVPMLLTVCFAKEFLDKGIAVADYHAFLESSHGIKHCMSEVISLFLPEASMIYIPAGCLVTWTNFPAKIPDAKQKSQEPMPNAFMVAIPVYEASIMEVPANVKAAIKCMNDEHFNQKSSSQMWAARAETFSKFFPANAGTQPLSG